MIHQDIQLQNAEHEPQHVPPDQEQRTDSPKTLETDRSPYSPKHGLRSPSLKEHYREEEEENGFFSPNSQSQSSTSKSPSGAHRERGRGDSPERQKQKAKTTKRKRSRDSSEEYTLIASSPESVDDHNQR